MKERLLDRNVLLRDPRQLYSGECPSSSRRSKVLLLVPFPAGKAEAQ